MAYLDIEISISNQSVADLNAKVQRPTKGYEAVQNLINVLEALKGGMLDGTVQITSRTTTASISTGGAGSQQESYTL